MFVPGGGVRLKRTGRSSRGGQAAQEEEEADGEDARAGTAQIQTLIVVFSIKYPSLDGDGP